MLVDTAFASRYWFKSRVFKIKKRRRKTLAGQYTDFCLSNYQSLNTSLSVLYVGRDVAPWKERSLMVRWVVGSILHSELIELFLVPASATRLV